jgi:xylan 1,4-beta-xylosidase
MDAGGRALSARRVTRARGAFTAAVLAFSSPVGAQAVSPANIAVDATAPGAPLERVWPFHGFDEVNYATTAEGAALLAELAALHTAPVHVRTHFLFNTGDGTPGLKWGSTNVYTEDASGNAVYDWTLTDGIMDGITRAGEFPFVELGFMPQALSTQPTPYRNASATALNGGCFYPPTDYAKWAELVRTWAAHADERYPDVAARWLWELWNEPDSGYWHGSFAEYATLYDHTEAALHAVMPSAVLGGPAVARADGDFLTQFLQHCASESNAVSGQIGTRLDLVTFHAKGGVALSGDHVELDLGNQLRLEQAGFAAVASFPAYRQTPIYITEADPDGCAACPISTDPADAYRNSTAYGAYELATMKHTLELESELGVKLGGVLTWAFTFPGTPYFAGYRVLSTNGIDLPVLSAFKLLGRLAGLRLPLTSSGARPLEDILANGVRADPDVDGMAVLDGGRLETLVWNYHDDVTSVAPTPVHLAVKLPASFGPGAKVSHLRVDESHGDAYSVWSAQGMPESPSPAQIAALVQAMEPAPLEPDTTVAIADGTLTLDFELPRFGVSLITLTPAPVGGETAGAGASGGGAAEPSRRSDAACACRSDASDDASRDAVACVGLCCLAVLGAARRRLRARFV